MRRLFRQFSFPGGIPSHVAPETPGSIHEGGELGYALAHAFGAAFDNPGPARRLRRRRRRGGDGAARDELALEQVPEPAHRRRRAADPAPERLQDREPDRARAHPGGRARRAARGLRLAAAASSRATSPTPCTRRSRRRSTTRSTRSRRRSARRASDGVTARPQWPMIVLRTPKGWTGPKEVDGLPGRGHVALAPGAGDRRAREPGAPADPRGVAAELPPGGAVRRRTAGSCRSSPSSRRAASGA